MAKAQVEINLEEIFKDYSKEIQEAFNESLPEIAKETISELKKTSPKSKRKRKKHYADDWAKKIEKGRLGDKLIIYNNQAQLTHLLENGHLSRKGNRVEPQPHIAQAQKKAEKLILEELERKLRG